MLTIIVPVFNEKKYIIKIIKKLINLKKIKTQLIIVDEIIALGIVIPLIPVMKL